MNKRLTEFMYDPIWFSPYNMLVHIEKIKATASQKFKAGKTYRKIIEAEAAAKMLACVARASKRKFWMQIVDDKFGSPDIKTICYSNDNHPSLDFLEVQDIEVVQFEEHAAEGLVSFLERTKFSHKKAYDSTTHILCHLGDTTTLKIPDAKELSEEISKSRINCPVLFLGSPAGYPGSVYDLMQLYPTLRNVVRLDIREEFRKITSRECGVMHFERGTRRPWIKREQEKHYPFEKLGLIPNSEGEYKLD